MNCKICQKDVFPQNVTAEDMDRSQEIFNEARDFYPDIKEKRFGQDGLTPVCASCVEKLAEKNPWLFKHIRNQ